MIALYARSNQTVAGLKHGPKTTRDLVLSFKSDRCGIETGPHRSVEVFLGECSNQTVAGLKLVRRVLEDNLIGSFKSDRCGIETDGRKEDIQASRRVQIRPLRD